MLLVDCEEDLKKVNMGYTVEDFENCFDREPFGLWFEKSIEKPDVWIGMPMKMGYVTVDKLPEGCELKTCKNVGFLDGHDFHIETCEVWVKDSKKGYIAKKEYDALIY